jgi:tRNA1Val (adenine37-N6)-methyltransferase
MKVTTDACLFGAWVAEEVRSQKSEAGSQHTCPGVLDIGTGTGLLSLMFAQKNQGGLIVGVEIDKDAVKQAKENINDSPWKDQIEVLEGDVKDHHFPEKYDIIISNPPFYEKEIRSSSDRKNIAHHSETLTLNELLHIIRNYLASDGSFFLLLPFKRSEEIKRLVRDHQLHIDEMIFVRQSVNHDYFRIMIKGKISAKENEETAFNEMSIWDEKQQYTDEFIDYSNVSVPANN